MTPPAEPVQEETEVVVVGGRCAGSATAIALARRGRRVIVLDGAAFPSDTLSTHLLFPGHVAELQRLDVWARVEAELAPPRHTEAAIWGTGSLVQGPFHPVEGHAFGSCVRRPGLDATLVDAAREAGAQVRERTRVTGLLRDADGRVTGVRWRTRDGEEGAIGARLVVGADGRHSTVAELVGTHTHHEWDNRRMMAYAYYRDPRDEDRHVAIQWRVGSELGTVFPCDGGLSLVLLMPSVRRGPEFRSDPAGTFEASVAAIAPMAERLEGCERESKVRTSLKHPSYFRHSTGPGWALTGDAGHFKDPVTAQGIRDALRFGRLLGEAVAPALDDPGTLDRALAAWEEDRDAQCLDVYQWANGLGLDDEVSPLESASYRWLAAQPGAASEVLDVFSRRRAPAEVFTPRRVARWAWDAWRAPGTDRAQLRRTLVRDVRREMARRREHAGFRRRRSASAARLAAVPVRPEGSSAAAAAAPASRATTPAR